MSDSTENNIALLALLKDGPFARHPMDLRQMLVEGQQPTDIAAEHKISGTQLDIAAGLLQEWAEAGETVLTWFDDDYPRQFRDVHDFPPIVFVRGHVDPEDRGVCVVGSRDPSPAAVQAAEDIAAMLVEQDVTVVAGLAKGIDAAAHNTALRLGGRTVAVIGTGIDRYYPAGNKALQQRLEREGMVLSQFWPGSPGTQISFPMRNAVMSAYGQATIIVVAGEMSGTRHQAKQAVAHGRPLVLSRSVAETTDWGRRIASDDAALVGVAGNAQEAVDMAAQMADELLSAVA